MLVLSTELEKELFNKSRLDYSKLNNSSRLQWQHPVCKHIWWATVKSRKLGSGCQVCSNKVLLKGFNDLEYKFPSIAEEWDWSKNVSAPSDFFPSSKIIVSWKCVKQHCWNSSIVSRVQKQSGCPICYKTSSNDENFGHKINVLKNYNKNIVSESLSPRSSKQFVWYCPTCSHSWEESFAKVYSRKHICPNCKFINSYRSKGFININNTCDILNVDKNHIWFCKQKHFLVSSGSNILLSNFNCKKCLPAKLDYLFPLLEKEWSNKNEIDFHSLTVGSAYKALWVCFKGHEWKAHIYSRTSKNPSGCPTCNSQSFTSKAEKELTDFVKTLNLGIVENVRHVLPNNKEIDIYIPDRNVAVEYNGLYWHSETNGKGKYYHYDKWKFCRDKGVQLIHVWEDDWNRNPDVVKRMIAHKMGATQERRVQARKLVVREITTNVAKKFLDEYHIQGATDGSIRFGLFENITCKYTEQKPVAVIVLKREPGTGGKTLNLLRYATSANVVGGFTKLLKYVECEFTPESIITFSDNTVSDGGLYKNNGFTIVKELKPDYMYVVRNKRVHKFNYRLKRFRDDPNLAFEEGLSESELAALNNISRVWDAGKIKWVKNLF